MTPQMKAFEIYMIPFEGKRNDVYLDSRHFPTVGIGHLVVSGDGLKFGDTISDTRIDEFFVKDAQAALDAATAQMKRAKIVAEAFLAPLGSVNFQLGTKWYLSFPHTWHMIEDGEYEAAANALTGTLWFHQTPVRVRAFQKALRALPPLA